MKTLDDAWEWYQDTKTSLARTQRIGNKYWDAEGRPWRFDEKFKMTKKKEVVDKAVNALAHLDDLAIVVLFSLFEAHVRTVILDQIQAEKSAYQHRVVVKAIESAKDLIEEGSFFRVLEPFKGSDNNLIEEVHQVRKYRNWVSHGRRGAKPPNVMPLIAYQRLQKCLTMLFPSIPDAWIAVGAYYFWEDNRRPGRNDGANWNKAHVNLQELVRTGQLTIPTVLTDAISAPATT